MESGGSERRETKEIQVALAFKSVEHTLCGDGVRIYTHLVRLKPSAVRPVGDYVCDRRTASVNVSRDVCGDRSYIAHTA